jgi:hypothetical protein
LTSVLCPLRLATKGESVKIGSERNGHRELHKVRDNESKHH